MQNRGGLFAGLVLILLGALFLFLNLAGWLLQWLDIGFDAWRLWPLILVLGGIAFYLPLIIWWDRRREIIGLVMPGTLLLANGLLLLYQSLTDHWETWAYAWTIEPIAVGVGLYLMYLFGPRDPGLLIGGSIVGGIGLVMLVIFGSMLGGPLIRLLGPLVLIGGGVLVLFLSLLRARAHD